MIVDFHNHYYPPEYLAALREGPTNYEVTVDEQGNPVLRSPGDTNVIVPTHRHIAARRAALDEAGIDMQVMSFTAPGTILEPPERSVALSRLVNDALARVVAENQGRFGALATLPLNDPPAALSELERVAGDLGFQGVMLFGNAGGVPLHDRRFWPLYEKASELDMVFTIHPTYPVGVEAMTDYWLLPMVGFLFDTTLAAAGLVYSGVVERFPRIRWVLAHLGGAIPYIAERLDRGFEAFAECRRHIPRPPSTYLRRFYYDTVNFDPNALRLALQFAGPDHLLAGSDYPHRIGSLEKMLESLAQLDLDEAEYRAIVGGNARRLLGLDD